MRKNWLGKIDTGLFYDSQREIVHSLERISAHNPGKLYPSHWDALRGEELERFLEGYPAGPDVNGLSSFRS